MRLWGGLIWDINGHWLWWLTTSEGNATNQLDALSEGGLFGILMVIDSDGWQHLRVMQPTNLMPSVMLTRLWGGLIWDINSHWLWWLTTSEGSATNLPCANASYRLKLLRDRHKNLNQPEAHSVTRHIEATSEKMMIKVVQAHADSLKVTWMAV